MREIDFANLQKDVQTLMDRADAAHDFSHVGRVVRMSLALAEELGADPDTVRLIALLHDVDDRKVDPEGGRAARLLEKYGVGGAQAEVVLDGVENISFSKGKVPHSTEGKIVQDADRLDALGAIGIARAFSYGGSKGRKIYVPDGECSVKHFYDKLFKLADMMNFQSSKAIARERTEFMKDYLRHFFEEACFSPQDGANT